MARRFGSSPLCVCVSLFLSFFLFPYFFSFFDKQNFNLSLQATITASLQMVAKVYSLLRTYRLNFNQFQINCQFYIDLVRHITIIFQLFQNFPSKESVFILQLEEKLPMGFSKC